MNIKHEAAAAAGEFVGTFSFLFFALGGTNAANNASSATQGGAQ